MKEKWESQTWKHSAFPFAVSCIGQCSAFCWCHREGSGFVTAGGEGNKVVQCPVLGASGLASPVAGVLRAAQHSKDTASVAPSAGSASRLRLARVVALKRKSAAIFFLSLQL